LQPTGRCSRVVEDPSLRSRTHVFRDRCEAGNLLAAKLKQKTLEDSIVLAIPAGGIPVGYCISKQLKIPLDIVVVRKVPVPWNPEAGFGAVALDGTLVLNRRLVDELGLDQKTIQTLATARLREIKERLERFRGKRDPPNLCQRNLILVDDGLASGFTMLVAVRSVRKQNPRSVIVAVPTGHYEALGLVSPEADEIFCLNIRYGPFFAVADAYVDWHDVSDEEAKRYLLRAWGEPS